MITAERRPVAMQGNEPRSSNAGALCYIERRLSSRSEPCCSNPAFIFICREDEWNRDVRERKAVVTTATDCENKHRFKLPFSCKSANSACLTDDWKRSIRKRTADVGNAALRHVGVHIGEPLCSQALAKSNSVNDVNVRQHSEESKAATRRDDSNRSVEETREAVVTTAVRRQVETLGDMPSCSNAASASVYSDDKAHVEKSKLQSVSEELQISGRERDFIYVSSDEELLKAEQDSERQASCS